MNGVVVTSVMSTGPVDSSLARVVGPASLVVAGGGRWAVMDGTSHHPLPRVNANEAEVMGYLA